MNYLVLRKKGAQSTLSLVGEGTMLDKPYDSWALKTGEQILFVNTQMHRVLKSHYMLGAYVDKAIYGYTYEEMLAILRSKLGPTDEDRYNAAIESVAVNRFIRADGAISATVYGVIRFGELVIHTLLKGFKFLLIMLLIPLIIRFFSKRK